MHTTFSPQVPAHTYRHRSVGNFRAVLRRSLLTQFATHSEHSWPTTYTVHGICHWNPRALQAALVSRGDVAEHGPLCWRAGRAGDHAEAGAGRIRHSLQPGGAAGTVEAALGSSPSSGCTSAATGRSTAEQASPASSDARRNTSTCATGWHDKGHGSWRLRLLWP
jgi:hypothetical protein